ncbi:MAG: quinone oxidoreductase family protein [Gammaproteobacteria bacterium]
MRAILVEKTGGPEVLRPAARPRPEPGAGEVRVKVGAAGVNFIDIYQRQGLYPMPLPFVPGNEGAGTVEALGAGVGGFIVGDRVAWCGALGAYAEMACVPARQLVKLPAGLDVRAGAALMLQGMTAHYLAHSSYPLKRGETCLVHAAAGGVGLLLLQVARRLGARIIATVSTDEKAALARTAGADEVIFYERQDFAAEVRSLTDGAGVAVVYDSVGRSTFDKSLDCLAPRGYLVLFGQSSGPVPPFDLQVLNRKGSLFVTRPTLAHYTRTREELQWRAGDILGGAADGSLKLRIDSEFPLSEAAAAQTRLASRQSAGKILLRPQIAA